MKNLLTAFVLFSSVNAFAGSPAIYCADGNGGGSQAEFTMKHKVGYAYEIEYSIPGYSFSTAKEKRSFNCKFFEKTNLDSKGFRCMDSDESVNDVMVVDGVYVTSGSFLNKKTTLEITVSTGSRAFDLTVRQSSHVFSACN